MRKLRSNKLLKYILIDILIGGVVFAFLIGYQKELTLMAIMDACIVAGVITFTFGWLLFVFNIGIFDIAVYGVRQFGLALAGKRPKNSLDEFLYNREKTEANIHRALFIAGGVYLFAGAILYIIYYTV